MGCDILSIDNERSALNRCLAVVETALAAYPTTLEEDEELLRSLRGLPFMLVTLRSDEKVVLRWWQRFFRLAVAGVDMEIRPWRSKRLRSSASSLPRPSTCALP